MNQNKLIYNIKKIIRIIMYVLLSILLVITSFIIFYVVSYKISEKNDKYPPFGLFTAISESMEPVIEKYDVLLIKRTDIEKLEVGDIITFLPSSNIFASTPITHKINNIENIDGIIEITTKGDANETIDYYKVYEDDIYGEVILIVPDIGKIQAFITEKGAWLIIVFTSALIIISYDILKIVKFFIQKRRNEKINEEL